jgi:glycosyltransferase involved in cell wall biosynthesis
MKLIVQIPCYNEAETLALTLADIPRTIDGVDEVEILVVDDGSNDCTSALARSLGVDHVVRHKCNRGLASAFRTGLDACLRLNADIIVNTDGDNQYAGGDIPSLIRPILAGKADIVIGDRQTSTVAHFSPSKKLLQKVGSYIVRQLSDTNVPDAVSGFRAFSRDAALRTNIVSSFSYTIETLIQAGSKQIAVTSVPIRTNGKTRESRLFRSIPQFVTRSLATLIRMYAMYQPLRVFFYISAVLSVVGIVPILRFLYFYFTVGGAGHIQSLVLGGVSLMMGFLALLIGLLADLISFNRQLLEVTLEKVRQLQLALSTNVSHDGNGFVSPAESAAIGPHLGTAEGSGNDRNPSNRA